MGMYNEVFYPCPEPNCFGSGYMQIAQLVYGFGGFSPLIPDSLKELTVEQLHQLKAAIVEDNFRCLECDYSFNPYRNDDEWDETVRRLF